MTPWKTLSRRKVLETGKFLTVEMHEVELPDGRVIPDWPWLVTPDYATIVAVTPDDRFLCFRQTKYAVEGISLALPGGFLEPGEDPLEGAKRELSEETGYAAPEWIRLGQYVIDANRGAGTATFFLARQARLATSPRADDLEEQELLLLTRTDVEQALAKGDFKVLAWAAAAAIALRLVY